MLHNDPDEDPSNEPYTCQRYVEAVTGATFKVKVSLRESFSTRHMAFDDAVKITIFYDGQKRGWFIDFTRAAITHKRRRGKSVECTFSHVSNFNEESQQWEDGATSFGALDMSKVHCSASRMSGSHCVYRGDCGFPNLLVRCTGSWQDSSSGSTSPSFRAIDAASPDETRTRAGHRSDGEDTEGQVYYKYCSVRQKY